MPKKLYNYNITFRVWNGWQHNLPGHYEERTETFSAENRKQAFDAARVHASNTTYWNERVTVLKKDVVRADRDPRCPEFPADFSAKEILGIEDEEPKQIRITITCDERTAPQFLRELAKAIKKGEVPKCYETAIGCAEISDEY